MNRRRLADGNDYAAIKSEPRQTKYQPPKRTTLMNTTRPTTEPPVTPRRRFIAQAICGLVLLFATSANAAIPAIEMPIEVVAGNTDKAVPLSVPFTTSAVGAATLQFWIHNLQYDGMASVKVNDGAMIPIANPTPTNSTPVTVAGLGGSYGGVGGGFHTILISLTLPASGPGSIASTSNTITFQLNPPYNKGASGFRVIAMALYIGGQEVITSPRIQVPPGTGSDDNPAWIAPNTAANIAAGQTQWQSASLVQMPGGAAINAKCADCHTHDGRDLRYFGFSNRSIHNRASFHGISTTKAQLLTRYIRSLTDVPTNEAWGRPWNPPYQPLGDNPATPGNESIGARAVKDWAAGGGWTAVLSSDAAMKDYLFPSGTATQALVDAKVDTVNGASTATSLKTYNIPVAVQFPDWNRWLPRKAPEDVWSDFDNDDGDGIVETPYEAYNDIRAKLTTPGLAYYLANSTTKAELVRLLSSLSQQVHRWVGAGATEFYPLSDPPRTTGHSWRAVNSTKLNEAVYKGTDVETAKRSLAAWAAVKYFEIMREFGLEDEGPNLFPNDDHPKAVGEPRGWPTSLWAVFAQAPHITANNNNNWVDHLTLLPNDGTSDQVRATLQGDYLSSVWYHLQMVLNAGQRQYNDDVNPEDWEYQTAHIQQLATESGVQDPLRMVETYMKLYQVRDNTKIVKGWCLRFCVPSPLFDTNAGDTTLMSTLESYHAGLWVRVLNAFIKEFHDVVTHPSFEGSNLANWPRYDPDNVIGIENRTSLEFATYQPSDWESGPKHLSTQNANRFWRLLPEFEGLGCDNTRLANLRNWCAAAWPGPASNPNQWSSHPAWNRQGWYYNVTNKQVGTHLYAANAVAGVFSQATVSTGNNSDFARWKCTPTTSDGTSPWYLMERKPSVDSLTYYLYATDVDLNPGTEIRRKITAQTATTTNSRFHWRLIHEGAGRYRIVNHWLTAEPWLRSDGASVYNFTSTATDNNSRWTFTLNP